MSWIDMRWVAEEAGNLFEKAHGPQAIDPRNKRFARDLLETWILAHILAEYEPILCSPSGEILRAPDMVRLHGDLLDYCSWSAPVDEDACYRFFFERSAAGAFSREDLEQRFCFIDAATGLIVLKNNSKSLIMGASSWDDRFIEKCIPAISRLVGWSICWNSASLPKTIQELVHPFGLYLPPVDLTAEDRAFLSDPGLRENVNRSRSRGRPSLVALILDAYDQHYPLGHRALGITWDQVTSRLIAETGRHLRVDHVAKTVNRRSGAPN